MNETKQEVKHTPAPWTYEADTLKEINAELLAALEAVENLLRSTWAEGGPNTDAYATALLTLQDAIAKARGQA